MMGEVLLGLPGPWAEDYREKADHYTTKIGGLPDWPIPEVDISRELLHCSLCGGRLSLVAQVYAPISLPKLNIEDRAIYILGCLALNCGTDPRSWRALRIQKYHEEMKPSLTSSNAVSLEKESVPAPRVNSWLEDNMLGNESSKVNDESDSDTEMEDLARALSEAAALASSSKKQNGHKNTDASARGTVANPRVEDTGVPVLPCFYIYSQKVESSGDMDAVCSGYTSLSLKNHCASPDTEDEEQWERETYEYDRALGADRTYLKFKKQMDAHPEQCLRYSYGGNPLFAKTKLPKPDICKRCGSSCIYEMQLMSPLLYFLQQAVDGSSACSADGWSWITLIVYTCSRSCCSFKESTESCCWEVAEEAIVIQDD
uniref:Programmed cell death protein 2 C-terminal domain-containing protein n=1 Tax=Musa acuminata subsp. malaccensis TaxID=214687 RepID=A0A804JJ70_MUSAM|nr:PREDICTED: programmed cell death protein 2-like isoform X1 [Musa acuminata subsp. malaccensis]XP_009405703.1 PREDICTED: programmed cell death protein 2-like isoform X1 [Musa acuminata subsp. malaccensis]